MRIKRIVLLTVLSIAFIITSINSMALADGANDPYGTYEDGIKVDAYRFHTIPPLSELTNGDFEEGFRYWTTVSGEPVKDRVKLINDNGNKYIELIGKNEFDGIVSPLFLCEKLKSGQMPVVIFDWRGSDDFQVYLSQWVNAGEGNREYRIGLIGGEIIKEAKTENEWNTSVTSLNQVLERAVDGNENIYLSIGVQRYYNTDIVSYIDNLRIGIVDLDTGKLTDYDGNELYKFEKFEVKKLSLTQQKDGVVSKPSSSTVITESENNDSLIEEVEKDFDDSDENTPEYNEKKIIFIILISLVFLITLIIVCGIVYIKRLEKTAIRGKKNDEKD